MSSYQRGFEYGVIHQLSEGPGDLLSYLEQNISAKKLSTEEYLQLGCVYVNQVRCHENRALAKGDYIRWHTNPRRYLISNLKLDQRVLYENEHLLILNKPSGIPCHPTVDNWKENLVYFISTNSNPVYITHRLDLPTQGILVLAKSKEVQSYVNELFQQRKIEKIYTAWTLPWMPTENNLEHWMKPSPRAPKELSSSFFETGIHCRLNILESKEIQNSDFSAFASFSEHRIQLLTGRTHQIRAQFSHEQHPLIGDIDYGGVSLGPSADRLKIALWSSQIQIPGSAYFPKLEFQIQPSIQDLKE